MLTVRDSHPTFSLTAVDADGEFVTLTDADHPDRWKVYFWWPMDFTFVCPTEIGEFGRRLADFEALNASVVGFSTDTHFVHLAWRDQHPELRNLPFPMAADTKRELSAALGILHPDAGVALRATFLVDPSGVIRHASVNDLSAGRNVQEVIRTLAALQTDGLTACGWQPGEATLGG
ncbi:MAG: peroxiredoxin [Proteobacteria bacterium]|nr:peroxiredoxin [Pseudomonadota bacterium]